jgi:hypothetical protein
MRALFIIIGIITITGIIIGTIIEALTENP